MAHPLVCYNEGTACTSKLRILRCAFFLYPVLLTFLKIVYKALIVYSVVKQIDTALGTGDYATLLRFTKTKGCTDLLSDEVETGYVQSQWGSGSIVSKLRKPNLESQLMIEHAAIVERLEKLTVHFAEHVSESCESLCQRKYVTHIKLSEYAISSEVWLRLLAYVICTNSEASSEQLYIYNYCKPRICLHELPCRYVLNGLQTVLVPPELNQLDAWVHNSFSVPSAIEPSCG